jgi:hypothetical protein
VRQKSSRLRLTLVTLEVMADLRMVSPREAATTFPCTVCGAVGCARLTAVLDRVRDDPRSPIPTDPHAASIPSQALDAMCRVGHGLEPADDEEHGELRRAASGPQAAALEPCAPWRLDTLRRHFGSSRLEELAGRVNEPDERRRLMALMEANGDVETAQAILESAGEAHGLDHEVTARGAGIASEALCTAVIQGEASDVRQQLEACGGSAALKLVTEEGSVTEDGDWDLLRVASVEGHTHILRMLVDAGAEPERLQAHTGRTPLFSAAYAGQAEAVCWLHRDCHADLSAPDDSAASPLWAAAKEGHASVVKYLLQHGADLPTRNRIKALELVVVSWATSSRAPTTRSTGR